VKEQPPLLPTRIDPMRTARCWLEEHPGRRAEVRERGAFEDAAAAALAAGEQPPTGQRDDVRREGAE
jgi:hypothetical protein